MMSEVEKMWNSPLGVINATGRRISLISSQLCTIHSVPYRALPETSEFEKSETVKTVVMGDAEPSLPEYASGY